LLTGLWIERITLSERRCGDTKKQIKKRCFHDVLSSGFATRQPSLYNGHSPKDLSRAVVGAEELRGIMYTLSRSKSGF
jgi:hypothetical protein